MVEEAGEPLRIGLVDMAFVTDLVQITHVLEVVLVRGFNQRH